MDTFLSADDYQHRKNDAAYSLVSNSNVTDLVSLVEESKSKLDSFVLPDVFEDVGQLLDFYTEEGQNLKKIDIFVATQVTSDLWKGELSKAAEML